MQACRATWIYERVYLIQCNDLNLWESTARNGSCKRLPNEALNYVLPCNIGWLMHGLHAYTKE